ncbi:NADH-quinone oxidoreductase subunit NuoN [Helicobacter sp. MIT 05-5294]|uniref:NADH-quinone oxidoreductase subunit NuoN n=1 Tax=Helicobacter sp. MIT 05-5294 TaxID=1548150 RepID=UPI0010FD35A3|nr:NADH-quinone oxidoreductase subunit NuoN [Helicobacter sp. MIT 05-5294]TLD85664.1 NADH-quinone oxidoreductase subunit NuoN [Helicobacter sp. MIT 05-5294]
MLEVFSVSLESLNLFSIFPMLIAIVGGLLILVVDMCLNSANKQLYTMLAILFLGLDLGYIMCFGISGEQRAFFDLILIDGIALLGQVILLIAAILFVPLTLSYNRFHEFSYPEYYALFLFMCAGFQFMVSSDHLIVIFLGLETASLALYTLIAMHNRATAFEAAIKYFTMGSLSAGCFAFGSMLLYAASGYLDIEGIRAVLEVKNYQPSLVLGGVVFFIAAIGFKASLVPFHTWTPDVYEGSNSFLAGFMSIVPKIAALVVAIRIFGIFMDIVWVHNVFYFLIVLTMTLPNLVALVQKDVKRMLAYSSISHAGFAFSAILIGGIQAYNALFLYWILFLFTNLGIFSMLWISRTKEQIWDKRYDHSYEKFSGLIRLCPLAAVIMGLFMLSLAGIPPFSVFWGKVYLMSAAINNGYLFLAFVMAINSAIAAYYYLKLIVYMFLKDPLISDGSIYVQNATLPLKIVVGIATLYVCFSAFAVDGLLSGIYELVGSSFM